MIKEEIQKIKDEFERQTPQDSAIEHHKKVMSVLKELGIEIKSKPKTFQIVDNESLPLPMPNCGINAMIRNR